VFGNCLHESEGQPPGHFIVRRVRAREASRSKPTPPSFARSAVRYEPDTRDGVSPEFLIKLSTSDHSAHTRRRLGSASFAACGPRPESPPRSTSTASANAFGHRRFWTPCLPYYIKRTTPFMFLHRLRFKICGAQIAHRLSGNSCLAEHVRPRVLGFLRSTLRQSIHFNTSSAASPLDRQVPTLQ